MKYTIIIIVFYDASRKIFRYIEGISIFDIPATRKITVVPIRFTIYHE